MDDLNARAEELAEAYMLTRPNAPADMEPELFEKLRLKDQALEVGFLDSPDALPEEEQNAMRRDWYFVVCHYWLKEKK